MNPVLGVVDIEQDAPGYLLEAVAEQLDHRRAQDALREGLLRARAAENLIKAHKLHLASDRTSCRKATANQFRLLIHTAAYG